MKIEKRKYYLVVIREIGVKDVVIRACRASIMQDGTLIFRSAPFFGRIVAAFHRDDWVSFCEKTVE